jgi:hypothetical protein
MSRILITVTLMAWRASGLLPLVDDTHCTETLWMGMIADVHHTTASAHVCDGNAQCLFDVWDGIALLERLRCHDTVVEARLDPERSLLTQLPMHTALDPVILAKMMCSQDVTRDWNFMFRMTLAQCILVAPDSDISSCQLRHWSHMITNIDVYCNAMAPRPNETSV